MFALPPDTLASLIRPAGYFRVKTKRLRNFLEYFIKTYDGEISSMMEHSPQDLREELLSVSGIGPETADSILLYALGKPVFVIDAYTKRIFSRHGVCDEYATYDDLQTLFMDSLPEDVTLYNEYHALIVETGKDFCRKNPECDKCPLKDLPDAPPSIFSASSNA
jgi:endonuclease-3 related protein